MNTDCAVAWLPPTDGQQTRAMLTRGPSAHSCSRGREFPALQVQERPEKPEFNRLRTALKHKGMEPANNLASLFLSGTKSHGLFMVPQKSPTALTPVVHSSDPLMSSPFVISSFASFGFLSVTFLPLELLPPISYRADLGRFQTRTRSVWETLASPSCRPVRSQTTSQWWLRVLLPRPLGISDQSNDPQVSLQLGS